MDENTIMVLENIIKLSPLIIAGISIIVNAYTNNRVIKSKLDTICEQVKKTNSRVTKLEDYNISHLDKYHSKH